MLIRAQFIGVKSAFLTVSKFGLEVVNADVSLEVCVVQMSAVAYILDRNVDYVPVECG